MQIEEVIIIGAGPAGLAAAIQLQRFGIPPLILERNKPGGLLWNANLVENYPGFPNGISGVGLVNLMRQQAEGVGVKITAAKVIRLDLNGRHFRDETDQGLYRASCAVIASGTQPRQFADFALPLREAGFQVIMAIGEIEENYIGSNCGQYVRKHLEAIDQKIDGYTYNVEQPN